MEEGRAGPEDEGVRGRAPVRLFSPVAVAACAAVGVVLSLRGAWSDTVSAVASYAAEAAAGGWDPPKLVARAASASLRVAGAGFAGAAVGSLLQTGLRGGRFDRGPAAAARPGFLSALASVFVPAAAAFAGAAAAAGVVPVTAAGGAGGRVYETITGLVGEGTRRAAVAVTIVGAAAYAAGVTRRLREKGAAVKKEVP